MVMTGREQRRRHVGARDGEVLRQASGTCTDHMIPETVVARAAGPWRRRGNVYHHESITNLGSPAKDSTILRPSKLRTRKCGMSPHTAGTRSATRSPLRHRLLGNPREALFLSRP